MSDKKKFKVGQHYHHWFKSGGGQLYVIVGMNKHFLFLSYDVDYSREDPGELSVISIEQALSNTIPGAHR